MVVGGHDCPLGVDTLQRNPSRFFGCTVMAWCRQVMSGADIVISYNGP